MSKGLEALEKLKNYRELTYIANITGYERVNCKLAYNDELKQSFRIVEKELEEKQEQDIIINAIKEVIEFNICEPKFEETEEGLSFTQQIILEQKRQLTKKELETYRTFILNQCFPKELKEYQEIKEIAKRYNWDDITSEIFNVKTDKKYRDLFNSAIVNIQEDYRKARALEIIKEKSIDLMALRHAFIMDKEGEASGYEWYNNLTLVKRGVYDTLTQEKWELLKEVLL